MSSHPPAYWIYVSTVTHITRVHREGCRYARRRAPLQAADNWWAGPFVDRTVALKAAERMGEPYCEDCVNCMGWG